MGDFVFSLRWHLEMCNFGPRVLSPPLVTHLAYSSLLLSIIIYGGSSLVIWPLTIRRADSRPPFTHQALPHVQMCDMGGRCNFKVGLHELPPGLLSSGNYHFFTRKTSWSLTYLNVSGYIIWWQRFVVMEAWTSWTAKSSSGISVRFGQVCPQRPFSLQNRIKTAQRSWHVGF